MKDWKKDLEGIALEETGQIVVGDAENFIETLLQEERERLVKEIEWVLSKEQNYDWTFTQTKKLLWKYLSKKGEKK